MIENVENLIRPLLPKVMRPGRYIGNELNIIRKDWRDVPVRFALAFPDVYEIGMSHVGMQILYHVCNQPGWLLAERVYSPWVDMESLMREHQIPLFSLETKRPVQQFDVLGITMQYELHYSNILNLLDLAGIPLKSSERSERDPLVIAGGPVAFNPEPMADYLDAVVLGDGEAVILEIANVIRLAKREQWPRKQRLKRLAGLPGVYIPSFYQPEYTGGRFTAVRPLEEGVPDMISACVQPALNEGDYPEKPLVPLIEIAHDRFSMEIMRGCGRGCRFCNAGIVYRPFRARDVHCLIRHADKVIANTGYDEIALVSLSSSDYPDLTELLQKLHQQFADKGVSISFPSLRTESFTLEMAEFAGHFRKGGLTLAPEAGTQRLRDVINKNNNEEDLLNAVRIAFEKNWQRIKLYFMIGLPTETDEDIEGMIQLVGRVVAISKKFGKKEIHVSVSPFSPKPQTPFQWEAQHDVEMLARKTALLKDKIRWREVKLSWRDPKVSQLEAVMGLGDRRLGGVIENAWARGARFDGWSERFHAPHWERAFGELALDPLTYIQQKDENQPLPWDHLSKGVTRDYLLNERRQAEKGQTTPDCLSACSGCGLNEQPACPPVRKTRKPVKQTPPPHSSRILHGEPVKRRIRFTFEKNDAVCFTSHLDTMRIFARTFRRANIPLVLSCGFHAHPKISAGPPLPLGYTSNAEYFDIDILNNFPRHFVDLMNRFLPEGFRVMHAQEIDLKTPSLSQIINLAVYHVRIDDGSDLGELQPSLDNFLHSNSRRIQRNNKTVDIRPFVKQIDLLPKGIDIRIQLMPQGTARVDEVLEAIQPPYLMMPDRYIVCRTGLYIEKHGVLKTPFEVI